jgi:hypothetical protein
MREERKERGATEKWGGGEREREERIQEKERRERDRRDAG